MSVLKVDRKESKFEPITYSDELRDMLTELIQHSFGIRNPEYSVRKRYESKEIDPNEFWQYNYLIHNAKNRVDQLAALLSHNVCAANSIYPTNMAEYQKRRAYQNYAIVNCQQIIKELQRLIEVFAIDINLYPSKAELEDLLENIRKMAKEFGIHINEKKTRIVRIDRAFTFLQIKYKLMPDGRISKRLNPAKVTNMRRKLKKLAQKVKMGETSYENVENMFRGWMGSFYKLLTKEQRAGLLRLYEDLFNKIIVIRNKKMIFLDREHVTS